MPQIDLKKKFTKFGRADNARIALFFAYFFIFVFFLIFFAYFFDFLFDFLANKLNYSKNLMPLDTFKELETEKAKISILDLKKEEICDFSEEDDRAKQISGIIFTVVFTVSIVAVLFVFFDSSFED